MVERMIARRLNSPLTSSAGRLFDAVASLAGVCDVSSYEGQAAMELEWLVTQSAADPYPFEFGGHVIDTRPLIRAITADATAGAPPVQIATRFHVTLVEIIRVVCRHIREQTGLSQVALSGGVFQNVWLLEHTTDGLAADGFHVCRHRLVPPNDGGLCLGQVAVAAARVRTP